jgi:hypothetical protein
MNDDTNGHFASKTSVAFFVVLAALGLLGASQAGERSSSPTSHAEQAGQLRQALLPDAGPSDGFSVGGASKFLTADQPARR